MLSILTDEKTLENHCYTYWTKFVKTLPNTVDGALLFEEAIWNTHRKSWLEKECKVKALNRSKRFAPFLTSIEKGLRWIEVNVKDSIPETEEEDMSLLKNFPESFLEAPPS